MGNHRTITVVAAALSTALLFFACNLQETPELTPPDPTATNPTATDPAPTAPLRSWFSTPAPEHPSIPSITQLLATIQPIAAPHPVPQPTDVSSTLTASTHWSPPAAPAPTLAVPSIYYPPDDPETHRYDTLTPAQKECLGDNVRTDYDIGNHFRHVNVATESITYCLDEATILYFLQQDDLLTPISDSALICAMRAGQPLRDFVVDARTNDRNNDLLNLSHIVGDKILDYCIAIHDPEALRDYQRRYYKHDPEPVAHIKCIVAKFGGLDGFVHSSFPDFDEWDRRFNRAAKQNCDPRPTPTRPPYTPDPPVYAYLTDPERDCMGTRIKSDLDILYAFDNKDKFFPDFLRCLSYEHQTDAFMMYTREDNPDAYNEPALRCIWSAQRHADTYFDREGDGQDGSVAGLAASLGNISFVYNTIHHYCIKTHDPEHPDLVPDRYDTDPSYDDINYDEEDSNHATCLANHFGGVEKWAYLFLYEPLNYDEKYDEAAISACALTS